MRVTTARTYLVVIDDTSECLLALRYAALRAAHVGGALALLHVTAPPDAVEWSGVCAAVRAEAEERGTALLNRMAGEARAVSGLTPATLLREGEVADAVLDTIEADRQIAMLVLARAPRGAPGPLIAFFTGERAAPLRCLVTVVPGGLSAAELDRLT